MYRFFLLFLLCGVLQANPLDLPQEKKYNLSICAIFKNEARYLKEWIEYHRLVGVDHFYLYNNNSTDHFRRILEPYIKKGVVTIVQWPDCLGPLEENEMYKWALSTQIPAYENAIHYKAGKETKWLVFVDIDEFLVPFEKNTLTEQLQPYEEYASVTLSRIFYDASKTNTIPRRRLVIEALELTNADENPQKAVSKTIFKPEECAAFACAPYRVVMRNPEKTIELIHHDIRINRYAHRYCEGKLFLGKQKDTLHVDNRFIPASQMSELLEEGYEIEDQEKLICRFVPDLLRNLGFTR